MIGTVYSEEFRTVDNRDYRVNIVKPPFAKVRLVMATGNAREGMALVTRGYTGIYDYIGEFNDLGLTDAEIQAALDDIQKTQLKDPLAMVTFTWLINGVSRAFTHQLVRYAIATRFVQESMRFYGKKGEYNILVTGDIIRNEAYLNLYADATKIAVVTYETLVTAGVPSEDARGVLPTNILTHAFFHCSLLTLVDIYRQRMCCQAQQGEWQVVLPQMRRIIETHLGKEVSDLLAPPYERGVPCGYRASFDRPCVWQKEPADATNV